MNQLPESPAPVVLGAGTDPTHIPGLEPVSVEEPDTEAHDKDGSRPDAEESGATDAVPTAGGEAEDEDEDEGPPETGEEAADGDGGGQAPPEGPTFEVADWRGSIVADGAGVVLTLDDTEARFAWSEIGAVEIGSSRFGRRFEVTFCTTDHRRFDAEVQAPARGDLDTWAAELDAVLDVWFEEGRE